MDLLVRLDTSPTSIQYYKSNEFIRIWNGLTFVGLATTYFPKAHPRMEGFKKRDILKQIDYVGAILSIIGLTLLYVRRNSRRNTIADKL